MTTIRAHFDGHVIIPDEPVNLAPDSKVTVLLDSDQAESIDTELECQLREYYQNQSNDERAEDDSWGKMTSRGAGQAWE